MHDLERVSWLTGGSEQLVSPGPVEAPLLIHTKNAASVSALFRAVRLYFSQSSFPLSAPSELSQGNSVKREKQKQCFYFSVLLGLPSSSTPSENGQNRNASPLKKQGPDKGGACHWEVVTGVLSSLTYPPAQTDSAGTPFYPWRELITDILNVWLAGGRRDRRN